MLRENPIVAPYSQPQPNKKQKLSRRTAQLYKMLTAQLENLTSKLEAQTGEMAQGMFSEGDSVDLANMTVRYSKQVAMKRLWQNMRDEIERSPARLEQGTYGLCERCGMKILKERLLAMPSAAHCIDCARLQGQRRAN